MSVARRFYWRVVRRHDGEICHACGRPVALTCPTYWTTTDDLWQSMQGGPNGIRCIPCFAADCVARGVPIHWQAVEGV